MREQPSEPPNPYGGKHGYSPGPGDERRLVSLSRVDRNTLWELNLRLPVVQSIIAAWDAADRSSSLTPP